MQVPESVGKAVYLTFCNVSSTRGHRIISGKKVYLAYKVIDENQISGGMMDFMREMKGVQP